MWYMWYLLFENLKCGGVLCLPMLYIYLWLQYICYLLLPGSHLYCYVICAIPCLCTVVNVSILDLIDLLVLSTVSPCSTKGPVVSFFLCCLLDVDVLLNLLFCCCVCGIKKFQNILSFLFVLNTGIVF